MSNSRKSFLIGYFVTLIALWLCLYSIDREHKKTNSSQYLIKISKISEIDKGIIGTHNTPNAAKLDKFFWMSSVNGEGGSLDLLGQKNYLNSLFPGYGSDFYSDKLLWDKYFKSEFDPASYLNINPVLSDMGYRVSYSWTGCIDIYDKYGADVIVFGSSEVFKSLVPEMLSKELAPLFPVNPKVLFCGTYGMPTKAVLKTAVELAAKSKHHPKMVIWGYSFWQGYTRSSKLAEYQIEKDRVFDDYLKRNEEESDDSILSFFKRNILNFKLSTVFPKVSWNNILDLNINKLKEIAKGVQNEVEPKLVVNQEGLEFPESNLLNNDQRLSEYFKTNLKPYYAIVNGINNDDCSLADAKKELNETIEELKKLSNKVYVYIPPTTEHHRMTVPVCYLPSVRNMLAEETRASGIEYLNFSMEDFGLTDRDFTYPIQGTKKYYFDINHPNYTGAKKITRKITRFIKHDFLN